MSVNEIYERRSIRKYTSEPVPQEIIEKILDAGRVAPSAKNRQPWKYIVFANEAKKGFLDAMKQGIHTEESTHALLPSGAAGIMDAKNTMRIMREAPILLVVLNTDGTSPFTPISAEQRVEEICDTLSIGASIQNILLKATELGIGSLWIANTCFAYPELVAYLQTEHQLVGAIALGIPRENPGERPRKALETIVEYRV